MIGIFSKIRLDNEEIYLHIQNIFDTVLFGISGKTGYSNVENAIADQINNNLDEYINPWWKQDGYIYRKCSFHFIDELLVLDSDFCADFQKMYNRALIFTPKIKQESLIKKWRNKSVKTHLSGIFEIVFYFEDEDDISCEKDKMYVHLLRDIELVCDRDLLLEEKDRRKILEF